MNYEVKISESGRGGTVFYVENARQLSFDWEFAIDGALLFVPSPLHWLKPHEREKGSIGFTAKVLQSDVPPCAYSGRCV